MNQKNGICEICNKKGPVFPDRHEGHCPIYFCGPCAEKGDRSDIITG